MPEYHYAVFDMFTRNIDSIHDHTDDAVRRLIEIEDDPNAEWDIAYYDVVDERLWRLASYVYNGETVDE